MDELPAEAIDTLGCEAIKQGQFSLAAQMFTKAIEKDPSNGTYYHHRCSAYVGIFDMEKALEDGKKAQELKIDNYTLCVQLGAIYDFKKEWKNSVEYYEKALQLEPNNERIWALMRHSKARMGENNNDKSFELKFIEFIDTKGEEGAVILRSPQLYHFIDDISGNIQHCINYLGDPIMDLMGEFMMGGIIPPEIGARRVPIEEAKRRIAEHSNKEGEKN